MSDWQLERAREALKAARQHYVCAGLDLEEMERRLGLVSKDDDAGAADPQQSLKTMAKRLERVERALKAKELV